MILITHKTKKVPLQKLVGNALILNAELCYPLVERETSGTLDYICVMKTYKVNLISPIQQ